MMSSAAENIVWQKFRHGSDNAKQSNHKMSKAGKKPAPSRSAAHPEDIPIPIDLGLNLEDSLSSSESNVSGKTSANIRQPKWVASAAVKQSIAAINAPQISVQVVFPALHVNSISQTNCSFLVETTEVNNH